MSVEVRRNEGRSRYEVLVDGNFAGLADYVEMGDRVVLPHTEIDPLLRGGGLGEELVAGMLDDLRRRKAQVVARCWFVAQYIEAHPEYADLLAA